MNEPRLGTRRPLTSDGSRLTNTGSHPLPALTVQLIIVLTTLVFPLPSGPSTITLGLSSSSLVVSHSFSSIDRRCAEVVEGEL
jgi:hypothetical protein